MPLDATPNPLGLPPEALGIMYDLIAWLDGDDFDYGAWETCMAGWIAKRFPKPDDRFWGHPTTYYYKRQIREYYAGCLGLSPATIVDMFFGAPSDPSAREAADYVRALLETGSARW